RRRRRAGLLCRPAADRGAARRGPRRALPGAGERLLVSALWHAIGRRLPPGWGDLGRQLAVFAAFDLAYELSRALTCGDRATAMRHARSVVHAERTLGLFHELDVHRIAREAPGFVQAVANWTYFNCQFTVTFGFVLWVYLRRNGAYTRLRNMLIAIDLLG